MLRKIKHAVARKEWLTGRHFCGGGFKGHMVSTKGITFCNLCGKERRFG